MLNHPKVGVRFINRPQLFWYCCVSSEVILDVFSGDRSPGSTIPTSFQSSGLQELANLITEVTGGLNHRRRHHQQRQQTTPAAAIGKLYVSPTHEKSINNNNNSSGLSHGPGRVRP